MPVQSWLQAQPIRSFVRCLSLPWPWLLQTEAVEFHHLQRKLGHLQRLMSPRPMKQPCSTRHLPIASLEGSGRKAHSDTGRSWPVFRRLGDSRFNLLWQCFSPGGNLSKHPAFITFSTLPVCFPVFTMGSFCVFYVCVCVYPQEPTLPSLDSLDKVSVLLWFTNRRHVWPSLKTKIQTLPSPGQTVHRVTLFALRLTLWGGCYY